MSLPLSFIGALRLLAALATACVAMPALAHDGVHAAGFAAGLTHPLSGMDHALAMLAVGIWAAQQRKSMRWLLPAAFPAVMAAGALWGLAVPVGMSAGVEAGIAASVAVLGLLIAFAVRAPALSGMAVIAVFAALHGFAHGAEMLQHASLAGYGAGFIVGTIMLHLAGLGIGALARRVAAAGWLRASGAGLAAVGVVMLAAAV